MRNINTILRREIMSYLRTPSGYIIAAITMITDGIIFNVWGLYRPEDLSSNVLQRYLSGAAFVMLVLVALFAMRLLAEERTNGVQTLLFTSPVREHEIVLGKYLGGILFISVVTLLTLYLPALIFINGKVSKLHIAAGYGGILLMGASALGVATFASSLSKSPFVAVLLTALFLGLMEGAYFIGQISDGVAQTILPYFSHWMSHYLPSFSKGLLRLSDVAFFCIVVVVSLSASTRVLQNQRWQ